MRVNSSYSLGICRSGPSGVSTDFPRTPFSQRLSMSAKNSDIGFAASRNIRSKNSSRSASTSTSGFQQTFPST